MRMKKIIPIIAIVATVIATGCQKEDDFLDKKPTNILLDEQIWRSKTLVLNVLADMYDRMPNGQHIQNWWDYGNFNEAFISRNGDRWRFENTGWGYGEWGMWGYGYIREINIIVQQLEKATELDEADKQRFLGEARMLRALFYFEMVKRMGGVPLILEPLTYDFSGDPTYLQFPRAKEYEIYDFVINELDAVKSMLPDNPGDKTRFTKGAALAYISRVALYAGSIAKYGTTTPQVSLPGEEVGIPASKANDYYTTALNAAQAVTGYSLYMRKPDLSENFTSLFLDKSGNPEVIFAEDYKLKSGKIHDFTVQSQPMSMTEESFGGAVNPSLNLVEEFELLDNTFEPLQTMAGSDFVYYNSPLDIFAGRDARLAGTVILPGSSFKGRQVDIWAGFMLADESIITGTNFGEQKTLPGKTAPEVVVGGDGPISGREWSAQTGFLIRKYLDPASGAGSLGTQSDVWWIRIRYAEVLLNAAEAAFELNMPDVAADNINQVRQRAGFTTDLLPGEITFDRIVHERKVELAFENHILWDMKRWRLAHIVWNGNSMTVADLTSNLGEADKINTQVFGLIPYKTYTPSNPATDGKWVFTIAKPNAVTGSDRFQLGNYYSFIGDDIINNNPKIVRNPNQ